MDGSIAAGVIGENGEAPVGPLPNGEAPVGPLPNGEAPVGPLPNGVIPVSGVPPNSFGTWEGPSFAGGLLLLAGGLLLSAGCGSLSSGGCGSLSSGGCGSLSRYGMLEFVNIKSIRLYDQLIHEHYVEWYIYKYPIDIRLIDKAYFCTPLLVSNSTIDTLFLKTILSK